MIPEKDRTGGCDIRIRTASPEDAEAVREIYAPYVEKTAVTFEYETPDTDEFRKRIETVLKKYPWIVAEQKGRIAGYAYADTFKERAAYTWSVETSIYVKEGMKRTGIGKRLYGTLEQILSAQHILNLNACIAYTENEDTYLTQDSVHFHERSGYHFVGKFQKCGYKFGRWYDMVWMEKHIGKHTRQPEPVIWFPEIENSVASELRELYELSEINKKEKKH
ncbi:MAG TPA: GNAT family N-acetyltransferase [Candidatus Mediterraneibacter cottocaccae]|nr:GNAT family N-acetyltransferase [Candidatus Mediterraneibacter cottocaccae]